MVIEGVIWCVMREETERSDHAERTSVAGCVCVQSRVAWVVLN